MATALLLSLVVMTEAGFANAASRASARVAVTLTDAKLGVSLNSLQAGTATFVVVNNGRRAHALAVSGPGLRGARTPKLAPGQHATLTLTLRTGAYILSDPFDRSINGGSHWFVVNPASTVSSKPASGTAQTGTSSGTATSTFDPGGMNCD